MAPGTRRAACRRRQPPEEARHWRNPARTFPARQPGHRDLRGAIQSGPAGSDPDPDQPGERSHRPGSHTGRRPGLSPQRSSRQLLAAADAAGCDRTQGGRRGVLHGEGTRPGHAQLHWRCGSQYRHRRQRDLSQPGRGAHDGLVMEAGDGPSLCRSLSYRRRRHARNRTQSDDPGRSIEQDRCPDRELHPCPARRE